MCKAFIMTFWVSVSYFCNQNGLTLTRSLISKLIKYARCLTKKNLRELSSHSFHGLTWRVSLISIQIFNGRMSYSNSIQPFTSALFFSFLSTAISSLTVLWPPFGLQVVLWGERAAQHSRHSNLVWGRGPP